MSKEFVMEPLIGNIGTPCLPIEIKYERHILKSLFKLAEEGKWDEVNKVISEDCNLVNGTLDKEDEDAGKTLLWIATLQLVENYGSEKGYKAYAFIKNLCIQGFPLNISASPLYGPLCGADVIWLLAKHKLSQHLETMKMLAEWKSGEESEPEEGVRPEEENWSERSEGPEGMGKSWKLIDMLLGLDNHWREIKRHNFPLRNISSCNLNSAPKEGDYQGVTSFCLLLGIFDQIDERRKMILEKMEVILDSNPPPIQNVVILDNCNVIMALFQLIHRIGIQTTTQVATIDDRKRFEEIQNKCFHHLIKIIEANPYCDVNFLPSQYNFEQEFICEEDPSEDYYEGWDAEEIVQQKAIHEQSKNYSILWKAKNGVEMTLSLPSSPDRDKLLHYLIFIGAKPTETANPVWQKEYGEIKEKLNEVCKKALLVFHSQSSLRLLPNELVSGILLDMIVSECPYLRNFPAAFILKKIAYGV